MIVSTPQDVALSDVRKGIAMLRKVSVPVFSALFQLDFIDLTIVLPSPDHWNPAERIPLHLPIMYSTTPPLWRA